MKNIKNWIFTLLFTTLVGGSVLALVPQSASAAPATSVSDCSQRFLTFPAWYRDLVKVENGECVIVSPSDLNTATGTDPDNGLSNFIWRIVLNIIEIGLQIVGYIAAGLILYGGFQFLTSAGDPQRAAKARTSILNAAIGLVISIASIAIVNLIMGVMK